MTAHRDSPVSLDNLEEHHQVADEEEAPHHQPEEVPEVHVVLIVSRRISHGCHNRHTCTGSPEYAPRQASTHHPHRVIAPGSFVRSRQASRGPVDTVWMCGRSAILDPTLWRPVVVAAGSTRESGGSPTAAPRSHAGVQDFGIFT